MQIKFRKLTVKEKNQIVKMIEEWCVKYQITCGESLCQDDDGNTYAPSLVADILDEVLKPEVYYGN